MNGAGPNRPRPVHCRETGIACNANLDPRRKEALRIFANTCGRDEAKRRGVAWRTFVASAQM